MRGQTPHLAETLLVDGAVVTRCAMSRKRSASGGGLWNGKEIVSADWVKRATTPVITIDPGRSYGYQWYMGDGRPPRPLHWVGGIGWGGQRLYAIPELDLVVAMNCGNYGKSGMDQSRANTAVLTDVVLPSFI